MGERLRTPDRRGRVFISAIGFGHQSRALKTDCVCSGEQLIADILKQLFH
jgi:hypothetical protein